MIWSAANAATYKASLSNISNYTGSLENWFTDIYVTRKAYISGLIGGATGSNLISGLLPAILCGQNNRAVRNYSAILNGDGNLTSGISSLAAGEDNQVFGSYGTCLGGQLHFIEPEGASNLGGFDNSIIGTLALDSATIGGNTNIITGNASNSAIVGGLTNRIQVAQAVILGGTSNKILGDGTNSSIAGGTSNVISGQIGFIGGGNAHNITSRYGAIAGGGSNQVTGDYGFIGGGLTNKANETHTAVVGGANNSALTQYSSIGGGEVNTIFLSSAGLGHSVIGGGNTNSLNADYAVIIGGDTNKLTGKYGVVLGGRNNVSSGESSVTMGRQCEAFQNGAVMFGDSTNAVKRSYGQDSFTLNYSGAVWITGGGLNARRGFNLYPTGDNPTTSTPGRSGDWAYKDNYLYVYTGDPADSNRSWGRVALSTLDGSPPSVVSNDHQITYGGTGWNAQLPNNYFEVSATGGGVRFAGPGNITATNLAVTIPAGQGTYVIDCIFGIQRGSVTTDYYYMLYNTTDSRVVPNTSGAFKISNTIDQYHQQSIKIITGIHSSETATSKNIQLYMHILNEGADQGPFVQSTGTMISYIKLR